MKEDNISVNRLLNKDIVNIESIDLELYDIKVEYGEPEIKFPCTSTKKYIPETREISTITITRNGKRR